MEPAAQSAPTNARPAAHQPPPALPVSTPITETSTKIAPVSPDSSTVEASTVPLALQLASPATAQPPAHHAIPPNSETSQELSALASPDTTNSITPTSPEPVKNATQNALPAQLPQPSALPATPPETEFPESTHQEDKPATVLQDTTPPSTDPASNPTVMLILSVLNANKASNFASSASPPETE